MRKLPIVKLAAALLVVAAGIQFIRTGPEQQGQAAVRPTIEAVGPDWDDDATVTSTANGPGQLDQVTVQVRLDPERPLLTQVDIIVRPTGDRLDDGWVWRVASAPNDAWGRGDILGHAITSTHTNGTVIVELVGHRGACNRDAGLLVEITISGRHFVQDVGCGT